MADRKIAIVKNGEQVASFPGDTPCEIVGDTLHVYRPTQTVHYSPRAWDFIVEDRDDLAQSPVTT